MSRFEISAGRARVLAPDASSARSGDLSVSSRSPTATDVSLSAMAPPHALPGRSSHTQQLRTSARVPDGGMPAGRVGFGPAALAALVVTAPGASGEVSQSEPSLTVGGVPQRSFD